MAKGHKHTPEAIEKIRQSKLGKKQTPETIEARFAYLRNTVRVSRNDAAMLDILRTWTQRDRSLWDDLLVSPGVVVRSDMDGTIIGIEPRTDDALKISQAQGHQFRAFKNVANAWLDGEDVMLAKLAQQ